MQSGLVIEPETWDPNLARWAKRILITENSGIGTKAIADRTSNYCHRACSRIIAQYCLYDLAFLATRRRGANLPSRPFVLTVTAITAFSEGTITGLTRIIFEQPQFGTTSSSLWIEIVCWPLFLILDSQVSFDHFACVDNRFGGRLIGHSPGDAEASNDSFVSGGESNVKFFFQGSTPAIGVGLRAS